MGVPQPAADSKKKVKKKIPFHSCHEDLMSRCHDEHLIGYQDGEEYFLQGACMGVAAGKPGFKIAKVGCW
jgi:hypothetical protein